MNFSRDLVVLLLLMCIGFIVGIGTAEAWSISAENAAFAGPLGSVAGIILGYLYLGLERWRGEEKFPPRTKTSNREFERQIVGLQCQCCGKRIIFVAEAFFCRDCEAPFHRRCGKAPRCTVCDDHVIASNRAILISFEPPEEATGLTGGSTNASYG